MVGEQRSGSNLLRLMLNQSSELACPHPPHLIKRFIDEYPDNEELDSRGFASLCRRVVAAVESNAVSWGRGVPDVASLIESCSKRTLFSIFEQVMENYAISVGARGGWLCKSLENIRWFDRIDANFESPLYIHIYRDPRDVCLSFRKAGIGSSCSRSISSRWAELQRLCLDARVRVPERFYSVCYEDLISSPDSVLQGLCAFLGIEFTTEMLEFHRSEEAMQASSSGQRWENLRRPVMSENFGKYRVDLGEEDTIAVERNARVQMKTLGYEPLFACAK